MKPSVSPLIVLRFRDIELNPGETVKRHRQLISRHGYCWWGWLWRSFERNPYRELSALKEDLSQVGPYSIALYDTNLSVVYQATCDDIASFATPAQSPDVDLTPAYYNNRQAPAWFRLRSINETDSAFVLGRICTQMPSAADDCFTDLLGRPVQRLGDLRRQEVTMWVLGQPTSASS